jgi:hypothetical protein
MTPYSLFCSIPAIAGILIVGCASAAPLEPSADTGRDTGVAVDAGPETRPEVDAGPLSCHDTDGVGGACSTETTPVGTLAYCTGIPEGCSPIAVIHYWCCPPGKEPPKS